MNCTMTKHQSIATQKTIPAVQLLKCCYFYLRQITAAPRHTLCLSWTTGNKETHRVKTSYNNDNIII